VVIVTVCVVVVTMGVVIVTVRVVIVTVSVFTVLVPVSAVLVRACWLLIGFLFFGHYLQLLAILLEPVGNRRPLPAEAGAPVNYGFIKYAASVRTATHPKITNA
jgi:hypothetical protein